MLSTKDTLKLMEHKANAAKSTISAKFLGITSKKSVAMLVDEKYAFGYGALYELKQNRPDVNDAKTLVNHLSTKTKAIHVIEMTCSLTTARYQFVGSIKETNIGEIISYTPGDNQGIEDYIESENETATETEPANINLRRLPATSNAENLKFSSQNKSNSNEALIDEFKRISAHRNTGITPYIKLKLVINLTKESRATIYRKQALGTFPPCIKRGKGSFWNFNDIEKYNAGVWTASAHTNTTISQAT